MLAGDSPDRFVANKLEGGVHHRFMDFVGCTIQSKLIGLSEPISILFLAHLVGGLTIVQEVEC